MSRSYFTIATINGTSYYAGNGSPNGVLSATIGSVYSDKNVGGQLYRNTDGVTAWSAVGGGGGGGPVVQFTWKSGEVPNPSAGLYGDFASALAAAASVVAAGITEVILFCVQPTVGNMTPEAPGAYDLKNISLMGLDESGAGQWPVLTIPLGSGISFLNIGKMSQISVLHQENSGLFQYSGGGSVQIGPQVTLTCDGPSSVFLLQGGQAVSFNVLDTTMVALDTGSIFEAKDFSTLSLSLFDNVTANTSLAIASDAGATVNVNLVGSAVINLSNQTGVLGTLNSTVQNYPYKSPPSVLWYSGAPTYVQTAIDKLVRGESQLLSQAAVQSGRVFPSYVGAGSLALEGICLSATHAESSLVTNIGVPQGFQVVQQAVAVVGTELIVQDPTDIDMIPSSLAPYFSDMFSINSWGWFDFRWFSGFCRNTADAMVLSDAPAVDYAGFQFSAPRGDLTIQVATHQGVNPQTLIDTGVTPVFGTVYRFVIDSKGTPSMKFAIYEVADGAGPLGNLLFEYTETFTLNIPTSFTWFSGLRVTGAGANPSIGRNQINLILRYSNTGLNG